MSKLLVLHGPNLNLLGKREPDHYGTLDLDEINRRLQDIADESDIKMECRQSNAEHQLVEWIQQGLDDDVGFIVINPAAFTHTSVALRDALAAVQIPFIEVHLSNVHRREPFRKHSYLSDIAVGVIAGLGADGYGYACRAAIDRLTNSRVGG